MLKPKLCSHLDQLVPQPLPEAAVCEACAEAGDTWVHLRMCQTCGQVHCCDSSPNQHASQHFHATGHPVVISAEPGEKWAWCYAHAEFMPYL